MYLSKTKVKDKDKCWYFMFYILCWFVFCERQRQVHRRGTRSRVRCQTARCSRFTAAALLRTCEDSVQNLDFFSISYITRFRRFMNNHTDPNRNNSLLNDPWFNAVPLPRSCSDTLGPKLSSVIPLDQNFHQ